MLSSLIVCVCVFCGDIFRWILRFLVSCWLMLSIGLSEVIGFWKIMSILWSRILRIFFLFSLRRLCFL